VLPFASSFFPISSCARRFNFIEFNFITLVSTAAVLLSKQSIKTQISAINSYHEAVITDQLFCGGIIDVHCGGGPLASSSFHLTTHHILDITDATLEPSKRTLLPIPSQMMIRPQ